ncbi:UDP-N-acetylmuramoyl-tripeptide--D-alanyl-D-alanine ligase [Candidatus Beckwithbacteria bacterium]|nr:UDP-N-acetylmuramoyl-tripeptide--D-alanyl-D-alanine ligase [Candidatus Beckwithbacteria bacterium]
MVLYPWQYLKKQLYFLQLENYDLKRFWKVLKHQDLESVEPFRQELVWTWKLRIVFSLSFILYLVFILFSSWNLYILTNITLLAGLLFLTLIYVLPALFVYLLILSVLLLTPFDQLAKYIIITKAKLKLKSFDKLTIIGITGSYGKTTLKEVLFTILSNNFNTVKTVDNKNTPLGIAAQIQKQITKNTRIFIVEMGAYYQGDIRAICKLTPPDIALLTGINEAHLERFGSLQKTIATKFELIETTNPEGMVILNADNQLVKDNYPGYIGKHSVQFYSFKNDPLATLIIKNRKFSDTKLEWSFELWQGKKKIGAFTTKLLGEYSLATISAAVLVALDLGIEPEAIAKSIAKLEPIPHRLQPIANPNGIVVIDDSYNGNSEGAAEAIKLLAKFAKRRKIYITPGLVETGEQAESVHFDIGAKLATTADLVILVKNSVTPFIAKGLEQHGFKKNQIIWFDSASQAHEGLGGILKKGDVVLFQNDWPDNYY